VIEAAPEDVELKRDLWRRLGRIAPESAILATNTSSLDVDDLAACVPAPSRVLATHWFNPAYEIPCVEVAPGRETSPAVVQRTVELLTAAGKRPFVVRNSPGFVANRIQFAAIREALLCVQEGMAPADVDEIVRWSFAARLAALGPLANADLGGLDTYLAIFDVLRRAHGDRFAAPVVLADLVSGGRLGTKSGAGIFDHTPESALAELRDDRLDRVLGAMRDEQNDSYWAQLRGVPLTFLLKYPHETLTRLVATYIVSLSHYVGF
jgi:3-hydroxybutyryl-CoA dehydrogenase